MEKRLGRGLGSLLSSSGAGESAPTELPVDQIRPNPYQPRREFNQDALAELRESIRVHGILQPVAVRRADGGFELIAGERRWRAARDAGLTSIPAVIRESADDRAMLELAIVENVQREDLNPMERARGYQRMVEELGLTQSAVAERVGLKRTTVTNHLRLLELEPSIQRMVSSGSISMGHARALLGLVDSKERARLADRVVAEGLSVRAVEDEIREFNQGAAGEVGGQLETAKGADSSAEPVDAGDAEEPAWSRTVRDRLMHHLGAKVELQLRGGGAGRIVVEFADESELQRIFSVIVPTDTI